MQTGGTQPTDHIARAGGGRSLRLSACDAQLLELVSGPGMEIKTGINDREEFAADRARIREEAMKKMGMLM
jgi:hypothetical protein